MAVGPFAVFKRFRLTLILLGVTAFVSIAVLGYTVAQDVQNLDRREDDSAQWSLSQAEIEFLEFLRTLSVADDDLDRIRLRFDVLYSRMKTLSEARVFAALRTDEVFVSELNQINGFLDKTVPIIDGSDAELTAALAVIEEDANEARRHARQMAIVGLQIFTKGTDQQRREIVATMGQLAAAIVALIAGLALTLFYLDRTNKRASARGRDLQRSATRLNTIIDTALDGVIVADQNEQIVEFNPAAEAIFETSGAEALGRPIADFLVAPPELSSSSGKGSIASFLQMPGRTNGFARYANGQTFPAEFAVESADIPGERILIVFVRDISRRVAAEAELVAARDTALESERLKSDFLATMSHEIRTPLNGLLGNMDLLRDTPLSPPQARYVQNMETSGRMLKRHISDVLDITQFDQGKMELVTRRICLPALIDDILSIQSGLAAGQDTRLGWEWEGKPLDWIVTDADRLQHILMNLISNAVKFTKGGSVDIAVSQFLKERQQFLRFKVIDSGTGIDADLLPRIFDDFVTGDASYDRGSDGTGLGLGIAKRFAEGLGGTLRAQSELGRGSTFTLDIPVEAASHPEIPEARRTLLPVASQKILVVEDNDINRNVVREMLEADGHRVAEAANGAEGIDLASKSMFDLILMDISMPKMDGCEAAKQIIGGGGQSNRTPIVALTANALPDDDKRFRDAGMVTTVTKPITRITLREVIRELAARPSALNQEIIVDDHLSETLDALGDDAFQSILQRFFTETDAFIDWLTQDPSSTSTLPVIAESAHQASGSAAVFGANRLKNLFMEIEEAARSESTLRLHALNHHVDKTWRETKDRLFQVCATATTAQG